MTFLRGETASRPRAARLLAALAACVWLLAAASPGLCAQSAQQADSRQGWWLQIKGAAAAQGATVLLGDIAVPQGDMPASAWKELAARPLWPAPERQGHQAAYSRERLSVLLRQHLGDTAEACVLPTQLVLQRGGSALDGQAVSKRVVEYLTVQAQSLGGEVDMKDLYAPDAVFLAGPRDRVEIVPTSPMRPGRVNLALEVRAPEGKVLRRYAVSAFLNVWKSVPCAIRPMNRLEQVNLANVQYRRKNLAHNDNVWDGSGGPWRMARSVGADQVIHTTDLEPVPVISRGEKVNLVYEGANIRLNVKAEALSDGGPGQTIQVRNLQSNRKITATVQDASTVVVR